MSGVWARRARTLPITGPESSSLELRLAMLLERPDPLHVLAGGEAERVHLVLKAKSRYERGRERHAHRGLDRLYRDRAVRRDLPAQRPGGLLHLLVVDEEFDEPDAERLLGLDRVACQEQPHRLTIADEPQQHL